MARSRTCMLAFALALAASLAIPQFAFAAEGDGADTDPVIGVGQAQPVASNDGAAEGEGIVPATPPAEADGEVGGQASGAADADAVVGAGVAVGSENGPAVLDATGADGQEGEPAAGAEGSAINDGSDETGAPAIDGPADDAVDESAEQEPAEAKPAAEAEKPSEAKPAAEAEQAPASKPAASKPAPTSKPATTAKPAATPKPETAAKPAATAKPATTTKPAASAKPAAATEPVAASGAKAAPAASASALKIQTAAKATSKKQGVKAQGGKAPSATISYRTHVQKVGWQGWRTNGSMAGTSGRSLRLEGLQVKLSGISGHVQYKVHVQNIGWQDVRADGTVAGTHGKSLRLEAMRIALTGEASKWYDIEYRTHVQKVGWQGWVKNGAMSGTSGRGLRLEGLEVRLVPKKAKSSKGGEGLVGVTYTGHVQSIGWQGWTNDGKSAGTSGRGLRVEALKVKLQSGGFTGGIEYQTHVQKKGWMPWSKNGAMAGTSGQSLRIEALKVRLTGEIAKTYDIAYRTHVQSDGWQGWVANGGLAGTTGRGLRVEALQIKLVRKGSSQNVSEGVYTITIADNANLALDDPSGKSNTGLQQRLARVDNETKQRYYVRNEGGGTVSFQNIASGLFLADQGGILVQKPDSTSKAQRWKLSWDGGVTITNASTGKGIAVGSPTHGAYVKTMSNPRGWSFTAKDLFVDGTYNIINKAQDKNLNLSGGSWQDGANIEVYSRMDDPRQAFQIEKRSGNLYRITNAETGRAVEAGSGGNVRQWHTDGSNEQLWKLEFSRKGGFTFTNHANGKVMTASGSGGNEANVATSSFSGSRNQMWSFRAVDYEPDWVLQEAYEVAEGLYSSTGYLITVDTTNNRLVVFEDTNSGWVPLYNWDCCTGAWDTPTPHGDHYVSGRGYSFGAGYTCYYYTVFNGPYYFHSVLYYENSDEIMESGLGKNWSHGCVRLDIDNAYWIWTNIADGTHVRIY